MRWTSTIVNTLGLHARAAAKLVELTLRFGSRISIRREGRETVAKSIMGGMMLAASNGTSIEAVARGDDAADAVGPAIIVLAENETPGAVSHPASTLAVLPDPAAHLGVERPGVVAELVVRRGAPEHL